MSYRIISDSASDLLTSQVDFYTTVPMHIIIDGKDWQDVPGIDTAAMQASIDACRLATSTSCPAPGEWLEAFADADDVFCITITSQLSGSYVSAIAAKSMYEEEHPDRHVYVIDSLATGPRMHLLIDHLVQMLEMGVEPETAYHNLLRYRDSTCLLFSLKSVQNFVRNGRINPLLGKAIGLLNIRLLGTASNEGKLEVLDKVRGASRTLDGFVRNMEKFGYEGGKVIIRHHQNEAEAVQLSDLIRKKFGEKVEVVIGPTTGLCSYYAEKGGLLVGFERVPEEAPAVEPAFERVDRTAKAHN